MKRRFTTSVCFNCCKDTTFHTIHVVKFTFHRVKRIFLLHIKQFLPLQTNFYHPFHYLLTTFNLKLLYFKVTINIILFDNSSPATTWSQMYLKLIV